MQVKASGDGLAVEAAAGWFGGSFGDRSVLDLEFGFQRRQIEHAINGAVLFGRNPGDLESDAFTERANESKRPLMRRVQWGSTIELLDQLRCISQYLEALALEDFWVVLNKSEQRKQRGEFADNRAPFLSGAKLQSPIRNNKTGRTTPRFGAILAVVRAPDITAHRLVTSDRKSLRGKRNAAGAPIRGIEEALITQCGPTS